MKKAYLTLGCLLFLFCQDIFARAGGGGGGHSHSHSSSHHSSSHYNGFHHYGSGNGGGQLSATETLMLVVGIFAFVGIILFIAIRNSRNRKR